MQLRLQLTSSNTKRLTGVSLQKLKKAFLFLPKALLTIKFGKAFSLQEAQFKVFVISLRNQVGHESGC